MNKDQDKKITTEFKCTSCASKFKKTCPEHVIACSPIVKCPKCGNKLERVS